MIDHRMKDAVGRNAMRGDGRGNRINQKWHIVIGNCDTHDPPSARVVAGFGGNRGASGIGECCMRDIGGGCLVGSAEIIGFTRQGTFDQRFRQVFGGGF